MADSNFIQVQQGNTGQESVPATDAVQTRSEVIDISDDDEGNPNELVELRHSQITVNKGDEFNGIRKEYQSVFETQHKALPPDSRLSRTFSDMALAVSSANKQHIMDRHKKEWKNAMNAAGKLLRVEMEEMEWFLDEKIHREKDENTFRIKILGGSVQRYKGHKKNAVLLEKMFEDLKEL